MMKASLGMSFFIYLFIYLFFFFFGIYLHIYDNDIAAKTVSA